MQEKGKNVTKVLSKDVFSPEGRDALANYQGSKSKGVYIDFRAEPGFKNGDKLVPLSSNSTKTIFESPAPCYGQLLIKANGDAVIFYAFVYSYNGPTVGPDTKIGGPGYHNGDIEYIYMFI